MIKGLLGQRSKKITDDSAMQSDAEADGYEILTAKLPGRAIIAFQNKVGQVAALEVTERGAEILKGLAAGAVLSELEDAQETARFESPVGMTSSHGTTRAEAMAFIHSLDLLDSVEKKELQKALPR
ncbi:MAG: hypothetical protein V2I43_05395 [Parvularcula sp.]|jgi:hypothetical protein|nr:hypothetical protein [Parvularcula sp.]